jgi:gas vesicle protein
MSNQNSGALFFAGLVMGGVVGASLALLLAPQSGEETRGQIRDKGYELRDRGYELRDEAVEGLTEAGHRAQAQVATWQDAFEKGKHSAAAAMSHKVDTITQAVTNSKDKAVEAVG